MTDADPTKRHSKHCRECKTRIQQLLERIYGQCETNHQFGWATGVADYEQTPIGPVLQRVAEALERHRGFGMGEFVKRSKLAGCDFWVPEPGFIVEFDERQHFTHPRKLALSAYEDADHLGFSTRQWIDLCQHHDARDADPPYRDEQRAWYDTLRDLVPSIKGMEPTVRLHASDHVWCSLDPESAEDRELFTQLLGRENPRPGVRPRTHVDALPPRSVLHVAMVFPHLDVDSRPWSGVPQSSLGMPNAAAFAGESVDFVLFPEGYIDASDKKRSKALKKLAKKLNAPMLVGATDTRIDSTNRQWQVLLRFDSDGSCSRVYTKHSTSEAVAFEQQDWTSEEALPTFELAGVTAGATICHDHYLGLLPRTLARRGACIWINPSYYNPRDAKWSPVLRLRAVENRVFSLCTLHLDDAMRTGTHPFGFSPDGAELSARKVGSKVAQPLSVCREAGNIYVVDLDLAAVRKSPDWSRLPLEEGVKGWTENCLPLHVGMNRGEPKVIGGRTPKKVGDSKFTAKIANGSVFVGVVPGEKVLDAADCFHVIDEADQRNCIPIIWNHWSKLPTDSGRIATLLKGRSIECCAPIVISDNEGIHELVELSGPRKIPVRRPITSPQRATIDMRWAWGLEKAFKMVRDRLPSSMRGIAMDRYRSLS